MANVTIYTSSYCPYCISAKRLLDKKGVHYTEISVDGQAQVRAEMRTKAGGRTSVPQIWIGDQHVGGCDDLYDLDGQGRLDPMLQG